NVYSNAQCTGSPIFTSTFSVSGNGNYQSATFTPSGVGAYYWIASYSGDSNNNPFTAACGASGETLTVSQSTPTITTQVSPSTITQTPPPTPPFAPPTLTTGFTPPGSITFNVFANAGCTGNPVFTSTASVTGNGNYQSGTFTPSGVGSYQFVATYSGDSNNKPFISACGATGETLVVLAASPTIITQVTPSTLTLNGPTTSAFDTATLSSGFGTPQGTITFNVYNANTVCSGSPLFTSTVSVNGNGSYASTPFTPPGAGSYNWVATYSGDANNNAYTAACGANGETLAVQTAPTTIITQLSPTTMTLTTTAGTSYDTATLSGGFNNPKGTITFSIYSTPNCSGSPLQTSSVNVNGNGNYASPSFTPSSAGTYQWTA